MLILSAPPGSPADSAAWNSEVPQLFLVGGAWEGKELLKGSFCAGCGCLGAAKRSQLLHHELGRGWKHSRAPA